MTAARRDWPAFVLLTFLATSLAAHANNAEVVAVAAEVGITPESLVIADLHLAALIFLERLEAAAEVRAALAARHAEADEAASVVTALTDQIVADVPADEVVGQYEAAVAALQALRQEIEAVRHQLRAIALEGVPEAKRLALDRWRAASRRRVPPAFRVLERTPSQWLEVEWALRAEKRALRNGVPVESDVATLLTTIRNHPHVSDAHTRMSLFFQSTKQLFAQYEQQD